MSRFDAGRRAGDSDDHSDRSDDHHHRGRQRARSEFEMLGRLWSAGVAVPYPVQIDGTDLLIEFIGDADGNDAPRLAELHPEPEDLDDLWDQCRAALVALAAGGCHPSADTT